MKIATKKRTLCPKMTKSSTTKTRDQKLAAKLKENLRRRKAQARARTQISDDEETKNAPVGQSSDAESNTNKS